MATPVDPQRPAAGDSAGETMPAVEAAPTPPESEAHPAPISSDPIETPDRHELVGEDMALVVRLCRRYRGTQLTFAELVSAGNEGLVCAAQRYDPGYGVPFQAYARHWIQRYIAVAIRQTRYPVTVPRDYRLTVRRVLRSRDTLMIALEREPTVAELAERTGLSRRVVEDVLRLEQGPVELDAPRVDDESADAWTADRLAAVADHAAPSAAALNHRIDIERLLPTALERLPERLRTIVSLSYGLASNGVGLTDAQIAASLGYSEERIRQLRHLAQDRLAADDVLAGTWQE
jgi:RNA polymerase primary sigma factor/RNA polymerase nonessential primary-like sigma factor